MNSIVDFIRDKYIKLNNREKFLLFILCLIIIQMLLYIFIFDKKTNDILDMRSKIENEKINTTNRMEYSGLSDFSEANIENFVTNNNLENDDINFNIENNNKFMTITNGYSKNELNKLNKLFDYYGFNYIDLYRNGEDSFNAILKSYKRLETVDYDEVRKNYFNEDNSLKNEDKEKIDKEKIVDSKVDKKVTDKDTKVNNEKIILSKGIKNTKNIKKSRRNKKIEKNLKEKESIINKDKNIIENTPAYRELISEYKNLEKQENPNNPDNIFSLENVEIETLGKDKIYCTSIADILYIYRKLEDDIEQSNKVNEKIIYIKFSEPLKEIHAKIYLSDSFNGNIGFIDENKDKIEYIYNLKPGEWNDFNIYSINNIDAIYYEDYPDKEELIVLKDINIDEKKSV